jgi:hypothetical protein
MMRWLIATKNMLKKIKSGVGKLREFLRVDFAAFGIILLYSILNFIIKLSS